MLILLWLLLFSSHSGSVFCPSALCLCQMATIISFWEMKLQVRKEIRPRWVNEREARSEKMSQRRKGREMLRRPFIRSPSCGARSVNISQRIRLIGPGLWSGPRIVQSCESWIVKDCDETMRRSSSFSRIFLTWQGWELIVERFIATWNHSDLKTRFAKKPFW